MDWGDAFKAAWKKATEAARQKAATLAVDAKEKSISYLKKKALETAEDWGEKKKQEAIEWANKKTAEVAEWSKQKTTQSLDWLEEKAIEVAPSWAKDGIQEAAIWAKDKSHNIIDENKNQAQQFFTKKIEDAYENVKNEFSNALLGRKSGEKIDWGDAFKAAWNKATDTVRNAAGALATGAKKVKDWAKEKASEVAEWGKEKYSDAKKKAAETADWVKKKTVQAATWVKNKAKQGYAWAKDKAIKFGKMAKDAYQAVKKKFGDMVAGAIKIICKTGDKLKSCWDKATIKPKPQKSQTYAGTVLNEIVQETIKNMLDPSKRTELKNVLTWKTVRGKLSAIANLIDTRELPAHPTSHVKKLFDGRKALGKNFKEAIQRLLKRSGKLTAQSAMRNAAKSFALKQLGLSAIVEFGFKLHEKGWDPRNINKQNFIEVGYGVGTGAVTGAIGAAIGTLIPIPVVGTVAGFLVGVGVGMVINDLIKSETIEFLDCIT